MSSHKGKVLVCDDDEKTLYFLEQIISKKDSFYIETSLTGKECLEKYSKDIDIVILDFKLPDTNGLKVLEEIKKINSNAVVIMATGYSTEYLILDSFRAGAYNYIKKPYDIDYLLLSLNEAYIEAQNRKISVAQGATKTTKTISSNNDGLMASNSKSVNTIINTIEKVSKKNISILLTGSSGTGKEFFANLIHKKSNRVDENFVPVNCPAIPSTLAESELFGHEKGSFTGADAQKIGKFELANKGIIFLDEVADLSLEVQSKLLRVLQEREIYRVGGLKAIPLDVMIISATSKNLREEIDKGNFRSDLYYRIADINLQIPNLRERKEDLPQLITKFAAHYAKENGETPKKFAPEVFTLLQNYDWPGNIRELKSFVRKMCILIMDENIDLESVQNFCRDQFIDITMPEGNVSPSVVLENNIEIHEEQNVIDNTTTETPSQADPGEISNSVTNVKDMEREMIIKSIEKNKNNMTNVAKELGMSRSSLYRKLKKYNISAK